jgi:hypothetical protein
MQQANALSRVCFALSLSFMSRIVSYTRTPWRFALESCSRLSLEYFEGPAGSGKIYSLVETLKTVLKTRPLGEHEAVLGLTYMHGSRRRMHGTLAKIATVHGRFRACTVDSLARSVVCRWRTMGRAIDPKLDLGTAPARSQRGGLLSHPDRRRA